jgi:hypothetical protein
VGGADLREVLDARAMQKEQESWQMLTPIPQRRWALAGTDAFPLVLGQRLSEMGRER